eukprot:TRINITY_DN12684_c0_g1_i5.p1 TRINITY_DN12684_c0_g1~~TRINITY_DN12684_c0_g1_i5.p1  ORF type:complete len:203 (+),score=71.95 TRINITY_DN12684_c0_g1_i5:115-723(+)
MGSSGINAEYGGTLMDYIVAECFENYPYVLDFPKEMENLEIASKASWDKIELGIKDVQLQLTDAKTLSTNIKIINEEDRFQKVLDKLAACEMDAKETQMVWDDVQKDWFYITKIYAKDHSKLKPEAFFGSVNSFVQKFKESKEKAIAAQKAKEEAEKKAAASEKAGSGTSAEAQKRADLAKKKAELEAKKEALRRKKEESGK